MAAVFPRCVLRMVRTPKGLRRKRNFPCCSNLPRCGFRTFAFAGGERLPRPVNRTANHTCLRKQLVRQFLPRKKGGFTRGNPVPISPRINPRGGGAGVRGKQVITGRRRPGPSAARGPGAWVDWRTSPTPAFGATFLCQGAMGRSAPGPFIKIGPISTSVMTTSGTSRGPFFRASLAGGPPSAAQPTSVFICFVCGFQPLPLIPKRRPKTG